MRIGGNEVLRTAMQVGEIAASTARDQDFLADTFGPFQHGHTATVPARLNGAHEPGRTRAQDNDVKLMLGRIMQTSDYPSFAGIVRDRRGDKPCI
jgi:hypothetical protein